MENTVKKAPRTKTKVNYFEDIKALLSNEGEVKYGTTVEIALAFIDEQIEALVAKAAKAKASKEKAEARAENERLKAIILDYLGDCPEGATCSDMIKSIPDFTGFSTSKISSLTSALVKDGVIVRQPSKKGRTPFVLA